MHDVYVGEEKIGRARNWKAAELMVTALKGGKWKVAKQYWLFGRVRRAVYSAKPLST